jgi:hypothetical protein
MPKRPAYLFALNCPGCAVLGSLARQRKTAQALFGFGSELYKAGMKPLTYRWQPRNFVMPSLSLGDLPRLNPTSHHIAPEGPDYGLEVTVAGSVRRGLL